MCTLDNMGIKVSIRSDPIDTKEGRLKEGRRIYGSGYIETIIIEKNEEAKKGTEDSMSSQSLKKSMPLK